VTTPAKKLTLVLELARWAPSGDNTQPWQFEVLDGWNFVIHGRDTRTDCVYDLDGRASQLSLGALIETIDIAASAFGLDVTASRRTGMPETSPTFDVTLHHQPTRARSPLVAEIPARSVNRRPLSTRTISPADRQELSDSVGPDHELLWFASWADRLRWTRLLWANAGLRLRLPEAFEVHKRVIEWRARFSADRIPDQALGAGDGTLLVMRHAMASWARVKFLNRWLGGTLAPRLEMDLIPALACGAHIAIAAKEPVIGIDGQVSAGRAVQRFWLTATRLGLQHQPAVTPLVFSRFIHDRLPFTKEAASEREALRVAALLRSLIGARTDELVWLGRLGYGRPHVARSLRRPLTELTL